MEKSKKSIEGDYNEGHHEGDYEEIKVETYQ
jgi:hypothetical protein